MKKLIAGILPIVLSTISIAAAGIIQQKDVQTLSSCNSSESHDVYYYIPSDQNITIYPDDTYWNTSNAFINKSSSSVDIYRHGVISQCSDWDRMSNFVRGGSITPTPLYPALIFRNEDGCVFGKPTYKKTNNPTAIDAQIHYTVGFNLFAQSSGSGRKQNTGEFYYKDKSSEKFICYPNWKEVTSNTACDTSSAYYWEEVDYHTGECLNYHVFRCGDGLVNSPKGYNYDNGYKYEECDPKAPGWNETTCNPTTCKANPVSCGTKDKGSTYFSTKQTTPWLTTTSAGMCAAGLTVGTPTIVGTDSHLQWTCSNANGTSTTCVAYQQWCGDGIKNGNEVCDPEDGSHTGRGDGCSNTCDGPTYTPGVCGSTYNGKEHYQDINSQWLQSDTIGLCSKGTVTQFNFNPNTGKYTWKCDNYGNPAQCTAQQLWCGDGIKNGSEQCDDGPNNGTSTSSCSATCTNASTVSCGTKDKGSTYFSTKQTTPWLTTTSVGMCAAGLTVGTPVIVGADSHLEWTCSNANGNQVTCKAYQQWCGDGIKNGSEQCDYNDGNHTNWGNDGCSQSCEQKIQAPEECDQYNTFYYTLRSGYEYTFYDTFIPTSTHYLYDFSVTFDERGKDYNRGPNPNFYWSEPLTNGVYMKVSTTRTVIESKPKYQILDHPDVRSKDNLYIEYNIKYADTAYSTKPNDSQLKNHKECAFYEISRCGDGVIDEEYGEQCDPGSEATNTLPEGQVCNAECKKDTGKKGDLVVEKTSVGSGYVTQTGQEIKWKIKVTASGGNVKDVVIEDDLPPVLSYVTDSSNLPHSTSSVTMNPNQPTITSGGKHLEWKTSGILNSGDSIVLSVTTKVDVMPDKTGYNNVACARAEGLDEKCDKKPIITGNPDLRIKKYFLNKDGSTTKEVKTVKIGDEIVYKIEFGNKGDSPATITSIKDFLPKNVQYKTGSIHIIRSSTHGNSTQSGDVVINGFKVIDGVHIEIYGGMTLEPGDKGYIIITGVVKGDFTDNRTNFACIYLNDKVVDCDDVTHIIEPENMCKKLDINPTTLSYEGGSVNVECTATAGQKAEIEIDCGNGTTLKKSNVSSLTGLCDYPKSDDGHKYKVVCKVNTETTGACEGSVEVKSKETPPNPPSGGRYSVCDKIYDNNGHVACKATVNEAHFMLKCGGRTYYYDDGYKWSHTFEQCPSAIYLDSATCYVQGPNDTEWKTNENCGYNPGPGPQRHNPDCIERNPGHETICELADPKCLDVNEGNFSMEYGEFLPLYFNVNRQVGDKHKYTFNRQDNCTDGTVDLGSLKCKYEIKGPHDNVVYSLDNINCLSLQPSQLENEPLIQAWINQQDKDYEINVFENYASFWPTINYTKSREWKTGGVLGEYGFYITIYEYDQCDENGNWQTHHMINRACQSNFVLSDSYTVQKTPSGNLKASTDTLSRFIDRSGGDKIFSDYLNAIATSEYTPNDKVNTAMKDFIQKYEKLAVKVNSPRYPGAKKVPGKNIYFISGDVAINGGDFTTPFTFVQTNPDSTITIKGDSNLNMMILTKGNIAFEGDCRNTQKVKGIFYASRNLIRQGVDKNDSLNHRVWCKEGGLNIKGVLIGNNFNSLMKNSRSHLETWFDDAVTSSKATKIMNGASVVIEYSPSIFTKSTMPPGAEDFTTALSIYKY